MLPNQNTPLLEGTFGYEAFKLVLYPLFFRVWNGPRLVKSRLCIGVYFQVSFIVLECAYTLIKHFSVLIKYFVCLQNTV